MTEIIKLDDWATDLWLSLPSDIEDEPLILNRETLPNPPLLFETDHLVIKKSFHDYGNFRVDYPQWYTVKEVYGRIGVLILAALFHDRSEIKVRLTHNESEIKNLVIGSDHLAPIYDHFRVSPVELIYYVGNPGRYPWIYDNYPPNDLPFFDLTNEDDLVSTEEQRMTRDTLRGFGGIVGTIRFASLLLNSSRPKNAICEFALEGDAGFRGVTSTSVEIRLWLPGGDGWTNWFSGEDGGEIGQ